MSKCRECGMWEEPGHECSKDQMTLREKRDEARHIARCLARFLREWDGLAEVRGEMAGYDVGTPECEL